MKFIELIYFFSKAYINPFTQEWEDADCFSTAYDSNVFRIDNVTTDMNGYQFMCIVSVPGMEPVESEIATIIVNDSPETTVDSGTCGENLTWELDSDGLLTISGTGDMYDYSYNNPAPWNSYSSSINSVKILDGVISIGAYAFLNCECITKIDVGKDVAGIGNGAFYRCYLLQEICVSEDNSKYLSEDGVLFDKQKTALIWFPDSKTGSYTIPESVKSVEPSAFSFSKLTKITMTNNAEVIGNNAFEWCSNLTEIQLSDNLSVISARTFQYCSKLTNMKVPDGISSIGDGAFSNCTSLESLIIPERVTSIGAYAFKDCSLLTTVYYGGTESEWNAITIGTGNECLTNATIQYAPSSGYSLPTNVRWEPFGTVKFTVPDDVWAVKDEIYYRLVIYIDGLAFHTDVNEHESLYYSTYGSVTSKEMKIYADGGPQPVFSTYSGEYKARVFFCAKSDFLSIYPGSETETVSFTVPEESLPTPSNLAKNDNIISWPKIDGTIKYFYYWSNGSGLSGGCYTADNYIDLEDCESKGMSITSLELIALSDNPMEIASSGYSQWFTVDELPEGDYRENPAITSQPVSCTVDAGGSATLSVTAEYSGSGELSYLWKSYNKYTKQWEDANDFATSYTESSFTVDDVTKYMNDYKFKCVITAPNGTSVETYEVTITVIDNTVASGTCGENLTWILDSDGLLTISGIGDMADLSNPSDATWYSYKDEIKSVSILDGVTSIGRFAFFYCSNLTSISLSDTVSTINGGAIYWCENLAEITVVENNASFTSVDGVLFNRQMTELVRCPGGKSGVYSIPDSVVNISASAFCTCYKLTGVDIPDSVKTMGTGAFEYCSGLTQVKIPYGVTCISNYAFESCSNLTSVVIPDSVATIGQFAFQCSGLKSISIGSGITSIGMNAFNSTSLTNVYYNGSQTQWDAIEIASGNDSLINAAIQFTADNIEITYQPESCTVDAGGSATLSVTAEYSGDGELSYLWMCYNRYTNYWEPAYDFGCSYTEATLTLTEVTKYLNDYQFKCVISADGAESVETDVVKVTVEYIETDKKYGVLTYTEQNGEITITDCDDDATGALIIPDSIDGYPVTKIGNGAFFNNRLKSITIPSSVNSIEGSAFAYCQILDEIVFNHSATDELTIEGSTGQYGGGAFYNASSSISTAIYVDNTSSVNPAISGYDWSSSCRSVTYYPLSSQPVYGETGSLAYEIKDESVIIIGCDSDAEGTIEVPETISGYDVTEINTLAFSYCTGITKITIPAGVNTVSMHAFNWASGVEEIEVDSENENYCSIDGILYNKAKTELVRCPEGKSDSITDIPATVTVLGPSAFQYCEKIAEIDIPAGVNQIGRSAFIGCSALESIEIPDGVSKIELGTFMYCFELASAVIPESVSEINASAFAGCYKLSSIEFGHSADSALTIASNAFYVSQTGGNIETAVYLKSVESINPAISGYAWEGSGRDVSYKQIGAETVTIIAQPESCTVDAGGSATLSVTADYSGSGELSYLWKSYNKYTEQWEDANDFATSYTNSTFTVDDVTAYMNDYKFKCIITAPNGTSVETDEVTITVTEVPATSTATLTVSSGTLRPGKTVSLSVSLSENSNAKMMQFTVLYDSTKLKLESCEAGAGMAGLSPTINTDTAGKIVFAWDSTKAYTDSGSLMDMTFSVADGVTSGTADIKVDTSSKFIFRESFEKSIDVEVIGGAVSIYAWDMGDVNMDDSIDIIDCSLIRHYAAGLEELSDEQKALADVNGDGKVNVIDVNLVRRYVAELITSFPASRT